MAPGSERVQLRIDVACRQRWARPWQAVSHSQPAKAMIGRKAIQPALSVQRAILTAFSTSNVAPST
jgi:hypothetical protein